MVPLAFTRIAGESREERGFGEVEKRRSWERGAVGTLAPGPIGSIAQYQVQSYPLVCRTIGLVSGTNNADPSKSGT